MFDNGLICHEILNVNPIKLTEIKMSSNGNVLEKQLLKDT